MTGDNFYRKLKTLVTLLLLELKESYLNYIFVVANCPGKKIPNANYQLYTKAEYMRSWRFNLEEDITESLWHILCHITQILGGTFKIYANIIDKNVWKTKCFWPIIN